MINSGGHQSYIITFPKDEDMYKSVGIIQTLKSWDDPPEHINSAQHSNGCRYDGHNEDTAVSVLASDNSYRFDQVGQHSGYQHFSQVHHTQSLRWVPQIPPLSPRS